MTAVSFDNPDALFAAQDVAGFLGKTPMALGSQRYRGVGPPYVKVGRRVMYRARDLAEFIDANTVTPGAGSLPSQPN